MFCKKYKISVTGCIINQNCESCLKTIETKKCGNVSKPTINKKTGIRKKINKFNRSLFDDI